MALVGNEMQKLLAEMNESLIIIHPVIDLTVQASAYTSHSVIARAPPLPMQPVIPWGPRGPRQAERGGVRWGGGVVRG